MQLLMQIVSHFLIQEKQHHDQRNVLLQQHFANLQLIIRECIHDPTHLQVSISFL